MRLCGTPRHGSPYVPSFSQAKLQPPWPTLKPRQCIKKQRHYFADKGLYSLSYDFSSNHIQMWEPGIKKAECQRIDAFKLWCWKRLSRVSWTARRSNQSILKKINLEYSLVEELMMKLHWPPDARSWLTGKDPDGGKDWGQEDKGMADDEMIR